MILDGFVCLLFRRITLYVCVLGETADTGSGIEVELYPLSVSLQTSSTQDDGRARKLQDNNPILVPLRDYLFAYIKSQLELTATYETISDLILSFIDDSDTSMTTFDVKAIAYFQSLPIPSKQDLGEISEECFTLSEHSEEFTKIVQEDDAVSSYYGSANLEINQAIVSIIWDEESNNLGFADNMDLSAISENEEIKASNEESLGLMAGVAVAGGVMTLLAVLLVVRATRKQKYENLDDEGYCCDKLLYGDLYVNLEDDNSSNDANNSLICDIRHIQAKQGKPLDFNPITTDALDNDCQATASITTMDNDSPLMMKRIRRDSDEEKVQYTPERSVPQPQSSPMMDYSIEEISTHSSFSDSNHSREQSPSQQERIKSSAQLNSGTDYAKHMDWFASHQNAF